MLQARASGKFGDHRAFVRWLFRRHHGVSVSNYDLLEFQYFQEGKKNIIKINGEIGKSLGL